MITKDFKNSIYFGLLNHLQEHRLNSSTFYIQIYSVGTRMVGGGGRERGSRVIGEKKQKKQQGYTTIQVSTSGTAQVS
jgi:hypothetical protein